MITTGRTQQDAHADTPTKLLAFHLLQDASGRATVEAQRMMRGFKPAGTQFVVFDREGEELARADTYELAVSKAIRHVVKTLSSLYDELHAAVRADVVSREHLANLMRGEREPGYS